MRRCNRALALPSASTTNESNKTKLGNNVNTCTFANNTLLLAIMFKVNSNTYDVYQYKCQ